jgi:glycosyltransferase involved in cell wall biosynthesis
MLPDGSSKTGTSPMAEPDSDVRLSVVVPAYNEQDSIAGTMQMITDGVGDCAGLQVVLVNDGSTDSTLQCMRSIAEASAARVDIVDRGTNGGMGQALASGLAEAVGSVITWIPGDGEYEISEVLAGVALLDSFDIVLVRRIARGNLGRNLLSSSMYVLIQLLFRFDARRYCGIFVVPSQRWHELRVASADVFFTLEVALRARRNGWRIGYVEAEWRPRRAGRSKVFNLRTVVRNLGELLMFRVRLWRGS